MAIPNRQLFLDRFIEYNVERYQDKPLLVAVLQGLTLDQITITNFQVDNTNPARPVHFYDVSMPGVFMGINQKFIPADVETGKLFTILGHVDDENELSLKTEEGVYTMGEAMIASLLVISGKKGDPDYVLAQVKNSLKYSAADVDLGYGGGQVSIRNETIFGLFTVYESLYDNVLRYNGLHSYDEPNLRYL
jgi:hypothetical protein